MKYRKDLRQRVFYFFYNKVHNMNYLSNNILNYNNSKEKHTENEVVSCLGTIKVVT